jgi:hypothetical protein
MAVQLSGQVGVELIERAWDVVFEEPARGFWGWCGGTYLELTGGLIVGLRRSKKAAFACYT